jgi:chromate reductase, NAD(P)H dehydrogenase (quinone)
MSAPRDVAVIVGSLRRDSYSRKIANVLADLAPPTLRLEIVPIGGLTLYNQDDDTDPPPAPWVAFRERIRAADAVLFVTPEYNRSMPGALKNAIDIGSRPRLRNAWEGKPGAVASVSPGALGGFGANHHLRQTLVFVNVPTMQQPEAYVGGVAALFDAEGKLVVEKTREFLGGFMAAFAAWIEDCGPSIRVE